MSWADQKASLKAAVHATFALPALYTRASDDPSVPALPLSVRYNAGIRMVGGQSSNGFAQIIQDVPQLRIDKDELIDSVTQLPVLPMQDDVIEIPSEGGKFRINNIHPMDGKYHVVEVENFSVL
jgi:hypothetical protein